MEPWMGFVGYARPQVVEGLFWVAERATGEGASNGRRVPCVVGIGMFGVPVCSYLVVVVVVVVVVSSEFVSLRFHFTLLRN